MSAATAATAATSTVTVFIKNMSGDVLPLNVSCDATLDEIADQLTLTHPEFPEQRTRLFRFPEGEEKQAPVEEGDVLMAIVEVSFEERGVWSKGGQHYVRFAIPFRGRTMYVYPRVFYDTYLFDLTYRPETTTLRDVTEYSGRTLYDVICMTEPDVTPEEMSVFYDAMADYLDVLYNMYIYHDTNPRELKERFNPKEPIRCECGSIVQRSGWRSHTKTEKHRDYVKNQ